MNAELENKDLTSNDAKPVLYVRCLHSNENGITKGKIYNCTEYSDWGYDIYPDDFGSHSGWEKPYFEVVESNDV